MRIDIIGLDEAAGLIGYQSIKSFRTWCKRNRISIYSHVKGGAISRFEFEVAIHKPIVKKLKEEYENDWEEMYEIYLSDDKLKYFIRKDKKLEKRESPIGKIKARGPVGQSFLNEISRMESKNYNNS